MQHGQQEATIGPPTVEPHQGPAPYDGFARMPIAGSWRRGRSGKVVRDHDPYSGDTLLEIPLADARDVDEAYRAAAAVQPRWAAALPQDRRNVLERAARIAEARRDEVVTWLIEESGSTRTKALLEWQLFLDGLHEFASYPFHSEGRILPASIAGKESRVYRQPVGVVGAISPWNFPLQLSMRAVGPALAVGNAVVLKPASDTPVTGGLLIAKIFEEAGLPPGALSVIVGAGEDIGNAFVDHPVPRVIAFTGSTEVGRRIGERAGRHLKRTCLELGGNGPFIVLDDADLDRAVDAAVAGKFLHQGQSCLAINRILVDRKVHDAFLDRFARRVAALRVGDPSDPKTAIGPIINRRQLDGILAKVDGTIARDARVVMRGQVSGLVLSPIVLAGVTNDMPTAREEVFGPVASILRFDGQDEAIKLANDTEYGLSSAVFTRDVERGARLARLIEAGMTHVNDWPVNDEANTAFGGEKASGLGRFGGPWALEEVTTVHWISVQEKARPYPL
ncbi:MAG TPA: aldehyde dehydrogenase family protein [Labilithrix sp.]|nr:aldehyde dehydrogenase family protein [Labilithrix sp.]